MKKNVFAKLALIAVGTCAFAASAATSPATATFQVKMSIVKSCSVSASDINLGAQDSIATNIISNSTISVKCSKTTPYFIGLGVAGSTSGAGQMLGTSGNTDKVPYQLRSTASMTGTIWGNTATSTVIGNGVTGIGDGTTQAHTVSVTVPDANYNIDSYVETVTVNVNF
jgi:spore coat protein U-like protein